MPKVIVLLSDKRSGSTMLQDELCRHSSIRHVDYSPHTYFETHHWLKAAVLLDRPTSLYAGGRTYPGYGSRENARAYMVDVLSRNVPGYIAPEDDAALVFEGWETLCKTFATPAFFEKSPQILAQWAALDLLLDWIAQTRMKVRVIGLVRNPLAVQYSAQELFSTEAEARQFSWLNTQRNLLAVQSLLPAETFRLVRYEDLIAAPVERLAEICDFIGLAPEPQLGASVHVQSREKWREDPSYTLQLDPAVARVARHFDYTEEELANPHQPASRNRSRPAGQPGVLKKRTVRIRDRLLKPAYLRLKAALETARR